MTASLLNHKMKIATMITEHTHSFRSQQRGAATILMAIIMLFSITVVSIFTARTMITEQKISGNEFRSKQAFEAAEAGLQFGVAYFNSGGADHSSPPDGTDAFEDTNIDGTAFTEPGQPSYHVAFCDPDTATHIPPLCRNELTTSISTCEAPPLDSIALVYACGWSDDRTAIRTISQIVRFKHALPNPPKSPFTSRGDINITGTFTVINNLTDTTVWTGGDIENNLAKNSNKGKKDKKGTGNFITEIRINDTLNTISTITNNGEIMKGPDVIANDANLSNASSDVYFQNFFGKSKENIRGNANLVINTADGETIPSFANSLNKLIYATDNITVDDELGSEAQPLILVVNGTLTLAGDSVIYGVVYAIDVNTENDATINGALMIENSTVINDDLTINYDTNVLNAIQKIGMTGAVSGSWRDW